MPHTRSASKNLRKSEKRRLQNRATTRTLKTMVKKLNEMIDDDTPVDQLRKQYNATAKKLDKAAAKRVIHGNLAARKKSQMAKAVLEKEKAAKAAPPAPAQT